MGEITKLKAELSEKMRVREAYIKQLIERYGDTPSELLSHNRDMLRYYTGGYNTLIELERRGV